MSRADGSTVLIVACNALHVSAGMHTRHIDTLSLGDQLARAQHHKQGNVKPLPINAPTDGEQQPADLFVSVSFLCIMDNLSNLAVLAPTVHLSRFKFTNARFPLTAVNFTVS